MPPPHLPRPVCNVVQHKKNQRVKAIVAVAVFSLVAGISGASMVLGWIWPGWAEGDTWFASYNRPSMTRNMLDDRVRQEMGDRVVSIYKNISASGGINFIDQNSFVADAVLVSSDGWLAFYDPGFVFNKNLVALSNAGEVLKVDSALADRQSGLVFLKLKSGEDFKVVIFEEKMSPYDDAFIFQNNNWRHGWIDSGAAPARVPHLDTAPARFSALGGGNFPAGRIIISSQGRVLGFTKEDGQILASNYVTRLLPSVLSRQVVEYPSLGVEGWYSDEQPIIFNQNKIAGFGVSRVLAAGSLLQKGDIITEIDGRIADEANLWYIISGHDAVKLKVLRQGKEIELAAKVIREK